MIYTYGVTQQGHYHIKNNIVCQDYHFIEKISDNLCFAAVADGLGSELYTDIASRIAATSVVEYCKQNISEDSSADEILAVLKNAYKYALDNVYTEADKNKHDRTQYDTTLSCVVYLNGVAYYGHSGDSGIVALKKNGEYIAVTEQQRDESGFVFPLCFEGKWVFGKVDEVASVLLATDGMLETLFPSLLYGEKVNIYVVLAQYFMDNLSLGFAEDTVDSVQQKIYNFVSNIGENQVNDDKTLVCIVNTAIQTERKEEDYYRVPNWAELKRKKDEEFRRLAYPHLYKKEDEQASQNDTDKED